MPDLGARNPAGRPLRFFPALLRMVFPRLLAPSAQFGRKPHPWRRIPTSTDAMDPEFREWPIAFGDSGYLAHCRLIGEHAVVLAVRHQGEKNHA